MWQTWGRSCDRHLCCSPLRFPCPHTSSSRTSCPIARQCAMQARRWNVCKKASQFEARLLAAGCPLDQAEPYGNCLTYGPGHYETWAHWRRDRTVEPALRALVRSYEYEDWPRGRIVFDQSRDLHHLRGSQAPDTGDDRAPRNPISIAGGAHRNPQRLALQEQGHPEVAKGVILSALKAGRKHRAHQEQQCRTNAVKRRAVSSPQTCSLE
jgi:hypothetical protein